MWSSTVLGVFLFSLDVLAAVNITELELRLPDCSVSLLAPRDLPGLNIQGQLLQHSFVCQPGSDQLTINVLSKCHAPCTALKMSSTSLQFRRAEAVLRCHRGHLQRPARTI